MARISSEGTFVYCKGAVILDSWTVDCEDADALTQPEVVELVLKYITGMLVDAPKLQAQVAAQREMERIARKAPDA